MTSHSHAAPEILPVGPFGPPSGYSTAVADSIRTDDKQVLAILKIRDGASLAKAGCNVYSTSETLTILLGAGTPAALRRLAKDGWTMTAAWNRIDAAQRAIVLGAWSGALDSLYFA